MIAFLLYPFSLIPLRILYLISDCFAFLLYYIFKYRHRVVAENIYKSFRGLAASERISIEKRFYRNFCDNFIETIKLCSMSEKKLQSCITADYSQLEKILIANQNCHIYLGQQFNWQWAIAHIASVLKKKNVIVVYNTLSCRFTNDVMLRIEKRFGVKMVDSKDMKKEMVQFSGKQHILVVMADQNPKAADKSFWTSFLFQRTAFLRAPESHTAYDKTPSLFFNIIHEKRGHYMFILEPIFDFSESYKRGIIIKIFAEKLENAIISNPENYLWSHKRWKHAYKNEYHKRWINKHLNKASSFC